MFLFLTMEAGDLQAILAEKRAALAQKKALRDKEKQAETAGREARGELAKKSEKETEEAFLLESKKAAELRRKGTEILLSGRSLYEDTFKKIQEKKQKYIEKLQKDIQIALKKLNTVYQKQIQDIKQHPKKLKADMGAFKEVLDGIADQYNTEAENAQKVKEAIDHIYSEIERIIKKTSANVGAELKKFLDATKSKSPKPKTGEVVSEGSMEQAYQDVLAFSEKQLLPVIEKYQREGQRQLPKEEMADLMKSMEEQKSLFNESYETSKIVADEVAKSAQKMEDDLDAMAESGNATEAQLQRVFESLRLGFEAAIKRLEKEKKKIAYETTKQLRALLGETVAPMEDEPIEDKETPQEEVPTVKAKRVEALPERVATVTATGKFPTTVKAPRVESGPEVATITAHKKVPPELMRATVPGLNVETVVAPKRKLPTGLLKATVPMLSAAKKRKLPPESLPPESLEDTIPAPSALSESETLEVKDKEIDEEPLEITKSKKPPKGSKQRTYEPSEFKGEERLSPLSQEDLAQEGQEKTTGTALGEETMENFNRLQAELNATTQKLETQKATFEAEKKKMLATTKFDIKSADIKTQAKLKELEVKLAEAQKEKKRLEAEIRLLKEGLKKGKTQALDAEKTFKEKEIKELQAAHEASLKKATMTEADLQQQIEKKNLEIEDLKAKLEAQIGQAKAAQKRLKQDLESVQKATQKATIAASKFQAAGKLGAKTAQLEQVAEAQMDASEVRVSEAETKTKALEAKVKDLAIALKELEAKLKLEQSEKSKLEEKLQISEKDALKNLEDSETEARNAALEAQKELMSKTKQFHDELTTLRQQLEALKKASEGKASAAVSTQIAATAKSAKKIQELEQQLAKAQAENARLTADAKGLLVDSEKTVKEITDKFSEEIAILKSHIKRLEIDLKASKERVNALKTQLNTMQGSESAIVAKLRASEKTVEDLRKELKTSAAAGGASRGGGAGREPNRGTSAGAGGGARTGIGAEASRESTKLAAKALPNTSSGEPIIAINQSERDLLSSLKGNLATFEKAYQIVLDMRTSASAGKIAWTKEQKDQFTEAELLHNKAWERSYQGKKEYDPFGKDAPKAYQYMLNLIVQSVKNGSLKVENNTIEDDDFIAGMIKIIKRHTANLQAMTKARGSSRAA